MQPAPPPQLLKAIKDDLIGKGNRLLPLLKEPKDFTKAVRAAVGVLLEEYARAGLAAPALADSSNHAPHGPAMSKRQVTLHAARASTSTCVVASLTQLRAFLYFAVHSACKPVWLSGS